MTYEMHTWVTCLLDESQHVMSEADETIVRFFGLGGWFIAPHHRSDRMIPGLSQSRQLKAKCPRMIWKTVQQKNRDTRTLLDRRKRQRAMTQSLLFQIFTSGLSCT